MIEAILSRFGSPHEPVHWMVMLVLLALLIAYGLLEFALGLSLRKLWRLLKRPDGK